MGTKDTILALFEKNKGFFVSGERIASELNISRTAVWKAVKILQKEGYDIEAITNRGYCLAKNSDILSAQGVLRHLNDEFSDIRPEVFVTTDSTNTVCLKKAALGESEGYVAIAGAQTAGRGRRGNVFFSPAGTGIYMSILLRPEELRETELLRLTTMAAVAVCEAIESITDKAPMIKWVNDIYIDGKKVCGILCEASCNPESKRPDTAVVGIGINAYPPKNGFPEDIAEKAGSIFDSCHEGVRNQLAAEVINRFMSYYRSGSTDSHFAEYQKRSLASGKDVMFIKDGMACKAHVIGLDEECGLKVRYGDGTEDILRSGEISITGIDS